MEGAGLGSWELPCLRRTRDLGGRCLNQPLNFTDREKRYITEHHQNSVASNKSFLFIGLWVS